MTKLKPYKVTFYFNSENDEAAAKAVLRLENSNGFHSENRNDFGLCYTELRDGTNNRYIDAEQPEKQYDDSDVAEGAKTMGWGEDYWREDAN